MDSTGAIDNPFRRRGMGLETRLAVIHHSAAWASRLSERYTCERRIAPTPGLSRVRRMQHPSDVGWATPITRNLPNLLNLRILSTFGLYR
jgi:hypothetical protein